MNRSVNLVARALGFAWVGVLAFGLYPPHGQAVLVFQAVAYGVAGLGLLGSANWVAHPTKPIEKAVAMLNMDMIGRIKDGTVYIGGVGTGSSLTADLAAAENATHTGLGDDCSPRIRNVHSGAKMAGTPRAMSMRSPRHKDRLNQTANFFMAPLTSLLRLRDGRETPASCSCITVS